MKKFLGITVLGLILSGYVYAKDYSNYFFSFNVWLLENGYNQYLERDEEGVLRNNLKINKYKGRWSIPFEKNPNRDTLIYYNYKNLFSHETGDGGTLQWDKYSIPPSKNPYKFKSNLVEHKYIKKQMQKKSILSYLYFNDDQIVIDELTPKNQFGEFVNN